MNRGFKAVKFAAAVGQEGELAEIQNLRAALGPEPDILADFHWRYTSQEAVALISAMEPFGLAVAEAPVAPEDIEGLQHVARNVKTPVATGEELRTVHEYLPRFKAQMHVNHSTGDAAHGYHRFLSDMFVGRRVPLSGHAPRHSGYRHWPGCQSARLRGHSQFRHARVPTLDLRQKYTLGSNSNDLRERLFPFAPRAGIGSGTP